MKKSVKKLDSNFSIKPLVVAVLASLTMSTVHAVPMVLTGDSVGGITYTAASGNTAMLLKGAISPVSMTSTGAGNFVSGADTFTWRNDVVLGGGMVQSCPPPTYVCTYIQQGGIPLYTVSTSVTKPGMQFLSFNNFGTIETFIGLQSTQSAGPLRTKRFTEGWGWMSPNHTPVAAIPMAASANYTGMVYGNFVNGTRNGLLESRALAVVNYATRAITFNTTGSVVSGQLYTVPIGYGQLVPDISTYAPGLNLAGTLTYAAGTNTFTGGVHNNAGLVPGNAVALAASAMTGTLSGGFTGATANEMGGVFTLSNATNTLYEAGAFTASKLPSTVLPSTLHTPNRAMAVNGLVSSFSFNVDPAGVNSGGYADYLGGQSLSNPASRFYIVTTDSQGRVARINQPNGSMAALYPMTGAGSGFSMTADVNNSYNNNFAAPYVVAQSAEWTDGTTGFLYSNIGVWTDRARRTTTSGTNIKMDWHAYGSITPVASLPLTGVASYQGVVIGNYFDSTVATRPVGGRFFANASGSMDFVARTLALSTSGSTFDSRLLSYVQDPVYMGGVQAPIAIGDNFVMYGGLTNSNDAPGLNVSGTLTYVAGSNNFTGTVSNLAGSNGDQGTLAAGAMTGTATVQMNGPAATELSGVLSVKNAANTQGVVGALAAKKVAAAPVLSWGAYTVSGKEVSGTYTATLDAMGNTSGQTTGAGVVTAKSLNVNTFNTVARVADGTAVYQLQQSNGMLGIQGGYLQDPYYVNGFMTGTLVGPYWADFNPDYLGNGKLVFSYSNLGIKSSDPMAGAVANTMTQAWSWHAYGSATPAASIPVTASGTYYGIALGDYMNGIADSGRFQGLVLATANYANRAIAFASRGTVADSFTNPMQNALSPVLDLSGGVVANGLNFSGNLTYAAATNSFTGTVSSGAGTMPGTATPQLAGAMTGTASGQFNGPTANEMGGVFSLKNATGTLAMNGAFTANKTVGMVLPLSPFNFVAMTGLEISNAAAAVATAKTVVVRTDAVGMMSWLTDGAVTVGLAQKDHQSSNSGVPTSAHGSTATGNILYEVTPAEMGWTNPANAGWSYTLLGAWDKPTMNAMTQVTDNVSWHSVGSATAGASIPVTGAFTFNGIAAGSVSNGATFQSTMTAGVNFATRSISFATTGSTVTGSLCVANCSSSRFATPLPISKNAAGTFVNGLDMTGTLTYAAGVNSFTGTVSNNATGMLPNGQLPTALTGTAKGQFNGPTATEMGGVFKLSGSGYNVNGAFAGKR